MRLFIALELSDEIKEELARLQAELKKAKADIKWVEPKNIHLTLKFLGETDEPKTEEIKKALEKISSQEKPFAITLFKLGAFPNTSYMRVVWVGIDESCSEVERIAKSLEDELEKIGFPKEVRPFSAHLTLGRVKSPKGKVALKEKILLTEVQPKKSAVEKITLFKSTLRPNGPIYDRLFETSLTGK